MTTRPIPNSFGSVFYPEMIVSHFNGGWQTPQCQASDRMEIHPAAHALHYSSTCFEGLKAFRQQDGRVAVFRIDDHVARLRRSAELLYLPVPDSDMLKNMILEMSKRAESIIPDAPGALYLRPIIIGTDPNIGNATTPSQTALLYILASPVGDYLNPNAPLKLLVETHHQRCAPHMGSIKSGGNYASALHWLMQAKAEQGAQQVLFCPDDDVQETGAANFILIDGSDIITKPLTDEFLHGVTRQSILTLAQEQGYRVREENFRASDLRTAIENGAEAALTGTAAVIAPVTAFQFGDEEVRVAGREKCLALRQSVIDIQYGVKQDNHGWLTHV